MQKWSTVHRAHMSKRTHFDYALLTLLPRNMQGLKKICGQVLGERWISNSARSHRKNVSILCAQRKDNYHSIHGGIHGVSVGTCCWDGPFCRARKHISGYWAECTKKKIHDSKINEWREQFSILKDYDDKDLLMWRDSFNKMDKDKDNFISHADLQKSDWSLEKYTLFQNYDMDKNNLIDFGEYIQAVIDIDTQYFKNFFQGFSKIDIELEFQNKWGEPSPCPCMRITVENVGSEKSDSVIKKNKEQENEGKIALHGSVSQ
ncbi:conserved Plasmodium protein, unknown function [Plasmodium ovale curtisi]|uniref:EF-hand domain-containing protein n=1 Tax=Plasmodium ovale curtisi TaxID=864141 RepID=A0A1A8VPE0_PLAOA|nr:conserved Plasmodium protein, unknown function [Plasmodium ovale curtisi]